MNLSLSSVRSADCLAWQAYADACCEHDRSHARRAVEELRSVALPHQREADEDR